MRGTRIAVAASVLVAVGWGCSSTASTSDDRPRAKESTASLGLTTSVPSSEVAEALALTDNVRVHGRRVDEIEEGGPAAGAGLQEGDVILQLGKNDLYSADDIADFLRVSSPGDQVPIAFKRSGDVEARQSTVTLGKVRTAAATESGLRWQFAGAGQLPGAIETARAEKKKVLVGLSGAET